MKRLLVLGGGTAGTMVANKLRPKLPVKEWEILVVDQSDSHHYQPGYLFIPFGVYRPEQMVRPRSQVLAARVTLITGAIERVLPEDNLVILEDGGQLTYDYLVIATGTTPRPDQTTGMAEEEWRRSVHEFYTLEGAVALADRLSRWDGGRLVVHITEMPIKCPVAPLEFTFLVDHWLRQRALRHVTEITYVTPLSAAFTKPVAARLLGDMLEERCISLEPDFFIERVDTESKAIVSFDERVVPFDLLVTVPLNMGADYIARSRLGNELNYVPVDRHTFLSPRFPNIFALGDAADLPTSMAGSVAHFSVEVFAKNFVSHIKGEPMRERFDGHANCFVESGAGKGMLIDFNYETEPLPGKYPVPVLGPFSLLEETRVNHWGKMGFKWAYWNLLLPGRPLPVPSQMSMVGKKIEELPQLEEV